MNKKNYLFIALAALAFTACSNDDEPGVNNGPVAAQVTAGIEGVQTRASDTDGWESLDEIGITAVAQDGGNTNYTNKRYVVETTGLAGSFKPADELQTIYFQDLKTVIFSAYYPYMDENTEGWSDGTLTKTITSADQTKSGQKKIDFLYAAGAKASKGSPDVNFVDNTANQGTDARFKHCMSMVTLKFSKGDDTDLKNMTEFTVSLKTTGTFNTTNGEAKVTDTSESGLKITETPAESNTYTKSLILFPQDVANGQFDLSLTLGGQTYKTTLTLPNSATALAKGMNYTFTITVNKTAIKVEGATIAPWGDGGSNSGIATMM